MPEPVDILTAPSGEYPPNVYLTALADSLDNTPRVHASEDGPDGIPWTIHEPHIEIGDTGSRRIARRLREMAQNMET